MMELLEPDLTEEELAVYKRGRNAHSLQWPSMLQWQITAGLQALRH